MTHKLLYSFLQHFPKSRNLLPGWCSLLILQRCLWMLIISLLFIIKTIPNCKNRKKTYTLTWTFSGIMASTISLLPKKHFLCSLCRDIFNSPATIPCGHSFCLSCLCQFWTRHQSKYCPYCKRLFTERPDLSVNRILADLSENYRKTQPQKPPDDEMVLWPLHGIWSFKFCNFVYANTIAHVQVIDIEEMIQERVQKIERLKYSLELQKVSWKCQH